MNEEKCPHCGASMKKFWHRITPGVTKALILPVDVYVVDETTVEVVKEQVKKTVHPETGGANDRLPKLSIY